MAICPRFTATQHDAGSDDSCITRSEWSVHMGFCIPSAFLLLASKSTISQNHYTYTLVQHAQPRSLPLNRTAWPYFCSLVIS